MNSNGLYSTLNLYEAAYLLCRGYRLCGKERQGRRTVLQFQPGSGIREAGMDFYAGGQVEARELAAKYRSLKDFIFADRTEPEVRDGVQGRERRRGQGVQLTQGP